MSVERIVASGAWCARAADHEGASPAEVVAWMVVPDGPLPDGHPSAGTIFDRWKVAHDEASAAFCRMPVAAQEGRA